MVNFFSWLGISKTNRIKMEEAKREQIKLEKQKRMVKRMMDKLSIEEEINRKKIFHTRQIEKKLPLERGDLLLLENGHEYRVCKKEIRGFINQSVIKLKLVSDFPMKIVGNVNSEIEEKIQQMEALKLEEIKFETFEQLNQYWMGKKDMIRRITKSKENEKKEKTNTL